MPESFGNHGPTGEERARDWGRRPDVPDTDPTLRYCVGVSSRTTERTGPSTSWQPDCSAHRSGRPGANSCPERLWGKMRGVLRPRPSAFQGSFSVVLVRPRASAHRDDSYGLGSGSHSPAGRPRHRRLLQQRRPTPLSVGDLSVRGRRRDKGLRPHAQRQPDARLPEEPLADLGDGAGAVACAAGMAAVSTVTSLFDADAHLIGAHDCYGGTERLFSPPRRAGQALGLVRGPVGPRRPGWRRASRPRDRA